MMLVLWLNCILHQFKAALCDRCILIYGNVKCKPTQLLIPLPALKHLSEALQYRALVWITNEQEFVASR